MDQLNQYHVFWITSEKTDNPKTKTLRKGEDLYGVVESTGVFTGNFGSEEYQVLRDCCPGTRYWVQQAISHEAALEQALAANKVS